MGSKVWHILAGRATAPREGRTATARAVRVVYWACAGAVGVAGARRGAAGSAGGGHVRGRRPARAGAVHVASRRRVSVPLARVLRAHSPASEIQSCTMAARPVAEQRGCVQACAGPCWLYLGSVPVIVTRAGVDQEHSTDWLCFHLAQDRISIVDWLH